MVAQMLQMVSFDTILDHFGKWGQFAPTSKSAQLRLHSKWLSIRNSFGITPKGPMGPSPQGRRRRPWVPFGPLWVPLVSLTPPLPPWVPPKGSAPCRSDIGASRKFGDGAAFAGENKLGRRACAEREESFLNHSQIMPKSCPNHTQIMPKSYPNHAQIILCMYHMCITCISHVDHMCITCV